MGVSMGLGEGTAANNEKLLCQKHKRVVAVR